MIESQFGHEMGDDEIMFDHDFAETASFDLDECEMCFGSLVPMGVLGTTEWSRCRNCGIEVGRELPTTE